METLLWVLVTGGGTLWGYVQARKFVRGRLRYVDAVEKPGAPMIAGTIAALAAGTIAALLPIIGLGSAVILGTGVGLGVHHGVRDIKRLPGV